MADYEEYDWWLWRIWWVIMKNTMGDYENYNGDYEDYDGGK